MRKTTLLACALVLGAPFLSAQGKVAPKPPSSQAPRAAQLPSGESVMDRYIEATGGADAWKKIKSMVVKGTFNVPAMGMAAPFTFYRASPNLRLMEMDVPGMGKILEGCDGANVWGHNAMTGPTVKAGGAAADALDEAWLDESDWRGRYAGAETKGVEKVEGEDCYKVELARRAGGGSAALVTGAGRMELTEKSRSPHVQYFSKKTGLLVKMEAETEMDMGKIHVAVLVKDYRRAGGVLMPFEMATTTAGQTTTMTYSEVEVNTDVPRSRFDPPEAVRALIEKEAAKAYGGDQYGADLREAEDLLDRAAEKLRAGQRDADLREVDDLLDKAAAKLYDAGGKGGEPHLD